MAHSLESTVTPSKRRSNSNSPVLFWPRNSTSRSLVPILTSRIPTQHRRPRVWQGYHTAQGEALEVAVTVGGIGGEHPRLEVEGPRRRTRHRRRAGGCS